MLRVGIATTIRTVFLTVVIGCTGGSEDSTRPDLWAGSVRDSAGIRVVHNPEAGIWAETDGWTVQADLTIGERPGVPETEFGGIADVAPGPDGRIHVLDNRAGMVRVFDATGEFIRSIGRFGRGPGEFSVEAIALRVDTAGSLHVLDAIRRSVQVFDSAGTLVRTTPLGGSWREFALSPTGGYVGRVARSDWEGLVHVDAQGTADTLLAFNYDWSRVGGALRPGAGRGAGRILIPLLPTMQFWSMSSDGRIVAGLSSRYEIRVLHGDGAPDMIIHKRHASLALSGEERNRIADKMTELMREAGMSDEQIADALTRFSFEAPDSLPAFTGLLAGPVGSIWAQGVLGVAAMTASPLMDALNSGSPTWDVFCDNGRYMGRIALPPFFRARQIRGTHIYGVEADDFGIERVVRLQVRPRGSTQEVSCDVQ